MKEQDQSDETQNKEGESMGLREMVKRSSMTDWLLVLFTAALAGSAIYQFTIMGGQLDQMRKDQRPWVAISFNSAPLEVGSPVGFTITMVNKGKTPAREIRGDLAMDAIKNGEEPQLGYPLPHGRFTTGLLFPNDPLDYPYAKPRSSMTEGATERALLTQSEFDDYQAGRIFFVMYAVLYYKDFFGVDHWTRRCAAVVQANTPGTFTGQKCTNYGDVDSN